MNKVLLSLGLCLTMLLAGCTIPGPKMPVVLVETFKTPAEIVPERANVYFLRHSASFYKDTPLIVLLNEVRVAPLPADTFTMIRVTPGILRIDGEPAHALAGSWNMQGTLQVESGKAYYVLLKERTKFVPAPEVAGLPFGRSRTKFLGWQWKLVSEADAVQWFPNLKYSTPVVPVLDR